MNLCDNNPNQSINQSITTSAHQSHTLALSSLKNRSRLFSLGSVAYLLHWSSMSASHFMNKIGKVLPPIINRNYKNIALTMTLHTYTEKVMSRTDLVYAHKVNGERTKMIVWTDDGLYTGSITGIVCVGKAVRVIQFGGALDYTTKPAGAFLMEEGMMLPEERC